jgi:hypothetical protein
MLTLTLSAFAAEASGTDPSVVLLQYGAIGAFTVVLLAFAASAIKRERERADRAEEQLRELHTLMRTDVIPVLVKVSEGFARVTDTLADAAAALRERR